MKMVNFKKYLVLFSVLLLSQSSDAQFTFTNDLRGSITPDMIVGGGGGTQGIAYLTSGNADPVGAGWLRLNDSKTDQRGYFYINKSFPSTLGVLVDFEYKMWRNNANTTSSYHGGDGFSVFLFNAAVPFQIGGYGGSLGYARLVSGSNVISEGLAGGYIGIGFDAYGNFGNNNEGKPGRIPMDANNDPQVPNTIILRGTTTSVPATSNQYLDGVKLGDRSGTAAAIRLRNEVDYNTSPFNETRPTDAQFYRRVQIEVIPTGSGSYNIVIRWKRNISDANFTQLISYVTNEVPPQLLKLGFAASTGGAFNYHEVRNLMITTPGNLRVVKKADKDILRSVPDGNNLNQITYTVEVTNDTDAALTNVDFKDKVTDGSGNLLSGGVTGDFRITSITHTGLTNVTLPSPSPSSPLATNQITGSFNIAAKTTGRIIVVGTLNRVPLGNILNNTVTVLPTDIVDQDLDNNTSAVSTPVTAEGVDMVVAQSVNKACVDAVNGNIFSVVMSNMGNGNVEYGGTTVSGNGIIGSRDYARNRIELTEIIPPNTTVTATTVPSGWQLVQTINNSPSTGYTTRVYRTTYISPNTGLISDPVSVANDRSLNSGQSVAPFLFTIKGNSQFTNQVKVRFIQERGTMVGNIITGWVINAPTQIVELEPTVNINTNNENSLTVNAIPPQPTVVSDIVNYCMGQILPLSATTTNPSYVLNWYTTPNGFRLSNAPIPITTTKGTFKYYVSQSNGVCEGPLKEITVIVRNCRLLTNPMLLNQAKRN